MLETHIKVLASIYTVILIAVITSLLIFGGFEFKAPLVKGTTIQATIVDISQLKSRKNSKTTTKPTSKQPIKKPPKKAEPVKKNPPKKAPVIVKKTPKINIKTQEKERKESQERQKKLEEIRKKRKEAETRRKIEEQNLKDLASKTNTEGQNLSTETIGSKKGTSAADKLNQLRAMWQLAVIAAVERQWNKPVSANKNLLCHVKVRQIPGGGVVDAAISKPCNANAIVKKSILAAIHKADPLPYKGFEQVFDRNAVFIFEIKD